MTEKLRETLPQKLYAQPPLSSLRVHNGREAVAVKKGYQSFSREPRFLSLVAQSFFSHVHVLYVCVAK